MRQDDSKKPHDWAEGQSEGCVSCSSGPPWEGARIFQSHYHMWWIMDFGVRPRDETPKSGMAHCKLYPSQESENEPIQNQIDAHLFFWQSGDRPQGICATRTNCQSNFLSGSPWKTLGKGWHVCDQVLTALGCCTTTTPHVTRQSPSINFWAEKKHSCGSSAPLFAGSQPLWLLFIPPAQKPPERAPFCTLDSIQKSVTDELKGSPAEAFQNCYKQWKKRLRRCVAVQGNYFEGNNLDL